MRHCLSPSLQYVTLIFQSKCISLYWLRAVILFCFFFFQAEDGIRYWSVTGVQTCALPICLFTGGLGAHYGAERAGCTVIPMSGGQTEKQVQLIRDFRPDIIMVTPSYMQVIIEEFVRQGVDPRESSLSIGIFGAEPWTEAMRREIETNAGLDAVDIYGLSEVMGPGVAQECIETKAGP